MLDLSYHFQALALEGNKFSAEAEAGATLGELPFGRVSFAGLCTGLWLGERHFLRWSGTDFVQALRIKGEDVCVPVGV